MVQQFTEWVMIFLMGFMCLCLTSIFIHACYMEYRRLNPPTRKEQPIRQVGVIVEPEPTLYPLAKSHSEQS